MVNPPLKLVLDGTLFAECALYGANRDGMTRLAEGIAERLVCDDTLDIQFASTLYIQQYDAALKAFVGAAYPAHRNKILTRNPPALSNALTWRNLFRTRLARLPLAPHYAEIDGADLFHSFFYPFPASVQRNRVKRSITFLDLIPLMLPGYPETIMERTRRIARSVESNFAISISEYSRQDLLNYNPKIRPEQVFVVPLAAADDLFHPSTDPARWHGVKAKYGLPDTFFLTVSSSDHRKNIAHVVKSFSRYALQDKPGDLCLLLIGNGAHSRQMLDELGLADDVKRRIVTPTQFIDTDDLAVIYSKAVAFFFLSLYEGFGLPVLEAMQCGTPVVASNTTSLPEVAGNAAILLDPTDEDALAAAMARLYGDSALRARLSSAGLQRAAQFSWRRCADEYAQIFRTIVAS